MNSFTCEYYFTILLVLFVPTLCLICLVCVSFSHVSPEQYRHRFACLTFTVMDYDWLSTNDFAGEAVAPLSDFCWPGRPNATPAGKSVQPFILHLSRSKPSGTYNFRLYPVLLIYTDIILPSWETRGCSSGFPITSPIQHKNAVQSRDICVRCRKYSHLFALPSREANHEDAGRSHRRQGGSGVCPEAEGDWEVNGGGVKAVSAACIGVFWPRLATCAFVLVRCLQYLNIFPMLLFVQYIIPKWKEEIETVKLIAVF